jgi:manganese transport protein
MTGTSADQTGFGGVLDLGQIVFTAQAGAYFSYQPLWAIVFGTAAIILYMENAGSNRRSAHEPVFSFVRTCLGFRLGLFGLIASNLLNLITRAAELGGLAIVLLLLTGWPERSLISALDPREQWFNCFGFNGSSGSPVYPGS